MKKLLTKANEVFEVKPEDSLVTAYTRGAAKGYLVGVTIVGAIAGVMKLVETIKGNDDSVEEVLDELVGETTEEV